MVPLVPLVPLFPLVSLLPLVPLLSLLPLVPVSPASGRGAIAGFGALIVSLWTNAFDAKTWSIRLVISGACEAGVGDRAGETGNIADFALPLCEIKPVKALARGDNTFAIDTNILALAEINATDNGPAKLSQIERANQNARVKLAAYFLASILRAEHFVAGDGDGDGAIGVASSPVAPEWGVWDIVLGFDHWS